MRKKYFENKIESLHTLDPHSWWTKRFLYSSKSNPLEGVEDDQSLSDATIAGVINDFFVGISAGLPPIDLNVLSDLCDDYTDDFVVDLHEVGKIRQNMKRKILLHGI